MKAAKRHREWGAAPAAMLLTAGLWTAALAAFGIFPFGSRSILVTDLGQQYIEYIAAFYDILKKDGSLLFTWNSGLGINFLGLYAYYLASPFLPLILLFPRAALPEAVLLVVSLKLAAAAGTCSLFLRRGADVHGWKNPLFAAAYALSGYTVAYFYNQMWLDAVLLLPLVVLAVRHLAETRRAAPLTAAFFVLFYANFYTAYMAGLFSALYLLWLLLLRRPARKEAAGIAARFAGAGVLAAGLAAFLMVPTYLALKSSHGDLASDDVFWGFTVDPFSQWSKTAWGAYDTVTTLGTPPLYAGVLTAGLLPVYFFNTDIPKRERKLSGGLLFFLLFSTIWCPLDYAWHAFELPVWFPGRYAFAVIFWMIVLAARGASRPGGMTVRRMLAGFCGVAVLYAAAKVPEWLYPGQINTMTGWISVSCGLLAVYAALLVLRLLRRKTPPLWLRRAAGGLLALLFCAELAGNAWMGLSNLNGELGFPERADYAAYLEKTELMNGMLDDAERDSSAGEDKAGDIPYRVDDRQAYGPNEGLTAGLPTVSHYSSFSRREAFAFLKNCGVQCSAGYKLLPYGGSDSALDALLGVRYVFNRDERREGYILLAQSDAMLPAENENDGEQPLLSLWRNSQALPLAYFADDDVLSVPASAESPFALRQLLYSAMNGQNAAYYTPLDVTASIKNGTLESVDAAQKDASSAADDPDVTSAKPAGNEKTRVISDGLAVVYFTFTNTEYQSVQLYFNNNIPEGTAVYLDGARLNENGERLVRAVINLGYLSPGRHTVAFGVRGSVRWFSDVQVMGFDDFAFDRLASELRESQPASLEASWTAAGEPVVTGTVTAPRDGVLFTSLAADPGWSAEIDGKPAETLSVGDAFFAVRLAEGEHTFTLRYRPPGLTAGLMISGISAGLCLLWAGTTAARRLRRRNGRPGGHASVPNGKGIY